MLDKNEWMVKNAPFNMASNLIKQFHYAKSHSKQAVAIHGLYKKEDEWGRCYGITFWIPPASPTVAKFFSSDWVNVLALSRMVIDPDAPKNAASFLLSRSIKLLPCRYHTLCTYADTYQNHTGAIYRATNWEYRGLSKPSPVFIRDNIMVSRRKGGGTLKKQQMIDEGCELVGNYPKHRFRFLRTVQSMMEKPKQLSLL